MYRILPKSTENIIGIRVEGRMEEEDYKGLLLFIESLIKKHGTIRILIDLRAFTGGDLQGVLKTLPYFKYSSKVEKKALVTDQRWIYASTKLLSPFVRTEVRCFPSFEIEKAWKWVKK